MAIQVTGNHSIDNATAEIAGALRDADPGRRDQAYYDHAMDLRDRILRGAPDSKQLALVRELAGNYHNSLLSAETAMDAIAAAVL